MQNQVVSNALTRPARSGPVIQDRTAGRNGCRFGHAIGLSIAYSAHMENVIARGRPAEGDVPVGKRAARIEYEVDVLSRCSYATCLRYRDALTTARALADQFRVDAWFTVDHIHFIPLGSSGLQADRP